MRFDEPTMESSRVSVLYSPLGELRKRIFDLEDAFKQNMPDEFLSPDLNPIPDDAPLNVPRIEIESTHGHSNLSITPIRADLKTEYDEDYYSEVDKCIEYMENKSKALDLVINTISPDISFFAVKATVQWSQTQLDNESLLNEIRDLFASENLHDIEFKNFQFNFTTENDGVFTLTQVSNYRTFSSDKPINTPHPRISKLDEVDHGFKKEIEVNDRPLYNKGEESEGTENLLSFLDVVKNEIRNPLPVDDEDSIVAPPQ